VPVSGDAALLVFTDRTLWRAASGGGVGDLEENFDSYTADVLYGSTPVTAGFVTLSLVDGGSDSSWRIDAIPATFATIPDVNGTTFATTLMSKGGGFGGTQLSFAPVVALGFDYAGGTYSTVDLIVTTNLGHSVTIARMPTGTAFVGLVYDAGESFSTLTWSGPADGYFGAGIDNVEAFSEGTAPVPEPASMFLTGAGLAAIWARRKRLPGNPR
jgi:hypothetical protein